MSKHQLVDYIKNNKDISDLLLTYKNIYKLEREEWNNDNHYIPYIHYAVELGNIDALRLMFQHGNANINTIISKYDATVSYKGITLLHCAIINKNEELIKELLLYNPDTSKYGIYLANDILYSGNPLEFAIQYNINKDIIALIKNKTVVPKKILDIKNEIKLLEQQKKDIDDRLTLLKSTINITSYDAELLFHQRNKEYHSFDIVIQNIEIINFKNEFFNINHPNDLYLFHGTSYNNALEISKNNFDINKCIRNVFGKGIYFSKYPSISIKYGKYILLCKINLGYFQKNGSKFDMMKYDSFSFTNNNNYIIKSKHQILPLYLFICL